MKAYYTEDEIFEEDGKKKSITSGSEVEWMEEESYFFKLSDFEKKLLSFYEKNPEFRSTRIKKERGCKFYKAGIKRFVGFENYI